MKQTELIMGMPITVELVDGPELAAAMSMTFDYFREIDEHYSPYKPSSEVSQFNAGKPLSECSTEFQHILKLCEQTTRQTNGYFDIRHGSQIDPSGLVKGWAIQQVADRLLKRGLTNFSVEAGGDFQLHGHNATGKPWRIGIRNPMRRQEIIKVIEVSTEGVATSGTAIRGQHIYNPFRPDESIADLLSLTVIGPTIYDADRFATAAFAMGLSGIHFIESLSGFEAYAVTTGGKAILTSGLERYVV